MKPDFAGASAEAQVKYLQQLVRIQMDKNATLAMKNETLKMEHHLATKEMGQRLNDLQEICNKQRAQLLGLRRKPEQASTQPDPGLFRWRTKELLLAAGALLFWVLLCLRVWKAFYA